MGITKTLGGDRVGTGKKMTVELENFGRSTHDQGKVIRTDQAFGTLVPYYCNIGLNGDTFYMSAASIVRTLPTVGPIFGSVKQQIEFYHAPIRLYIAALHNNALGIGLKMENVKLPIMTIRANTTDVTKKNLNNQQISQDSLLAYLGIRGLGRATCNTPQCSYASHTRNFPAMFLLMYWDIYKNYYANKQEEIGYVITKYEGNWKGINLLNDAQTTLATASNKDNLWTVKSGQDADISTDYEIEITFKEPVTIEEAKKITLITNSGKLPMTEDIWTITGKNPMGDKYLTVNYVYKDGTQKSITNNKQATLQTREGISLTSFNLSNIDDMREAILAAPKSTPFNVSTINKMPYAASTANETVNETYTAGNASWYNQAGLGIKTYLSDRFNNWLSTEWIDGIGGINDITAVDVSDGKLTMDALILSKKIFDMMNRIAVSGGSYNDWQEAVYGTTTVRMAESPIYAGGYSSEIVFEEVVSNSAAETSSGEQPLGSLAGRGANKFTKGGRNIKIKCSEPSMIMVIGSFTPRIDYSQGNKWWNRLETMNDFHKPNLDKIGFQELLTEEFAAFDTTVDIETGKLTYRSAGKQYSWIEYMTEVNETFGSFAAGEELEFMAFNRTYSHYANSNKIKDVTTYIDPTLYNIAFADAKLSAKNLWVQVAIDCEVRRVMSAKQIPNL